MGGTIYAYRIEKMNIADTYNGLLDQISTTYIGGKKAAFQVVNTLLLDTYWKIGQDIVEFEQGGNAKSEYGSGLLEHLSKDLSLRFGKGFSVSNISRFRQFYLSYPIYATLSHKLDSSDKEEAAQQSDTPIYASLSHKSAKSIGATVSHQLTWSHYLELLKIDDPLERSFYENQCVHDN